jgi:hypothetical protein
VQGFIASLFQDLMCVHTTHHATCRGRWPGGATDAAGHVFLDLDPALFEVVLNWLRQFALSRGGNMHQPQVPQEKLEHMVVSSTLRCLKMQQFSTHVTFVYFSYH